jgi:hypothetical protein
LFEQLPNDVKLVRGFEITMDSSMDENEQRQLGVLILAFGKKGIGSNDHGVSCPLSCRVIRHGGRWASIADFVDDG